MRLTLPRRGLLALLLGGALGGCPLPQSLPEYPKNGPITPPRIQMDQVTPIDTLVLVDVGCAVSPAPRFTLSAKLIDENTYEKVEVRWFVDYDPSTDKAKPDIPPYFIDGSADGVTIERAVQDYAFLPFSYGTVTTGGLHVVELVVSNNFAQETAPPDPPLARPWRTPLTTSTQQFETQFFRWVFQYVPAGTPNARCSYPP